MVLYKGMYIEPSNIWLKKLLSDKTWADFKNFFAEEYCDIRKLQRINATQAGFHGANMTITIQDEIYEALYNLSTYTSSEKMYSPS